LEIKNIKFVPNYSEKKKNFNFLSSKKNRKKEISAINSFTKSIKIRNY